MRRGLDHPLPRRRPERAARVPRDARTRGCNEAEAERWAQGRRRCWRSSPARWRSSGARSASARRWRPRPRCGSPTPRLLAAFDGDCDVGRGVPHQPGRADRAATGAADAFTPAGDGRASRCEPLRAPRGASASARWRILPEVTADDPRYPASRLRDADAGATALGRGARAGCLRPRDARSRAHARRASSPPAAGWPTASRPPSVALDQLSKAWVLDALRPAGAAQIPVLPPLLQPDHGVEPGVSASACCAPDATVGALGPGRCSPWSWRSRWRSGRARRSGG